MAELPAIEQVHRGREQKLSNPAVPKVDSPAIQKTAEQLARDWCFGPGTQMLQAWGSELTKSGEKLVVESHVAKFGRSSFTISHVFRDASGEIAAEGTETRIWARKEGDARSLQAVPIPQDVKRRLGG